MPFAATWWTRDYHLCNKSDRQRQISMTLLIYGIKKTVQMNLFTKQKEIHRLREWTYGCQRRRTEGRDRSGVWDWQAHTDRCKRDDQQGPTVKKKRRNK